MLLAAGLGQQHAPAAAMRQQREAARLVFAALGTPAVQRSRQQQLPRQRGAQAWVAHRAMPLAAVLSAQVVEVVLARRPMTPMVAGQTPLGSRWPHPAPLRRLLMGTPERRYLSGAAVVAVSAAATVELEPPVVAVEHQLLEGMGERGGSSEAAGRALQGPEVLGALAAAVARVPEAPPAALAAMVL